MALAEVSNIQKEDASQEKAKQLPQPTGYHILVGLPNIDEKIHGKEFRLINDDTVEAVVEDPRGVGRV